MTALMAAAIVAAVLFGWSVLVVILRDRPHRLTREMYIRGCLEDEARRRS